MSTAHLVDIPRGDPRAIPFPADSPQRFRQVVIGSGSWAALRDLDRNTYVETIRLWNWRSGVQHLLNLKDFVTHPDQPCKFSPSGDRLALCGRLLAPRDDNDRGDSIIRIWDTATGELIATIETPFFLWDVAWSTTGETIAAGQEHFGWGSVSSTALTSRLKEPHSNRNPHLALLPDGETLIVHGRDLTAYRQSDRSPRWRQPLSSSGPVSVSPDGQTIAAQLGMNVLLWDAASGTFERALPVNLPSGVAFSPSGAVLFGHVGDSIHAYSRRTGQSVWNAPAGREMDHIAVIDKRLVVAQKSGDLRIWELSTQADDSIEPAPVIVKRFPPLTIETPPTGLTTPASPVDLTTLPGWRELARKAVRLHPRRAEAPLPAAMSKIGGFTFDGKDCYGGGVIWPRKKKWPRCEYDGRYLVPVIQLLAEDFPEMQFAKNRDVFQLFWCPHDHDNDEAYVGPVSRVYWWNAAKLGSEFREPPDLLDEIFVTDDYLPRECRLHPERVWEFDHPVGASQETYAELHQSLASVEQEAPAAYYSDLLVGPAPGWKLGGYADWVQDPWIPQCEASDKPMELLLTIASWEYDGASWRRWLPQEERALYDSDDHEAKRRIGEPADIMVGDAGNIYVFHSRSMSPDLVRTVFQCS